MRSSGVYPPDKFRCECFVVRDARSFLNGCGRIAIGGTIGTGLFLGTGKSLAEGGPASMLICYTLVGGIVYVALLLLGEMATQYPVAGK
jgi:amino acid transporter